MATPDRWTPWIEPRADCTTLLTVNSVTAAAIVGCSLVVTPHIDSRALVEYKILCNLSAGTGADVLRIRPLLNGSQVLASDGLADSVALNLRTIGDRYAAGFSFDINLSRNTTYTFTIEALLDTSTGSAYEIRPYRTHLGPILVMPRLHAPL